MKIKIKKFQMESMKSGLKKNQSKGMETGTLKSF